MKSRLDFWTCFFLDSTDFFVTQPVAEEEHKYDSGLEEKEKIHLFCRKPGKFITGSEESGHVVSIVLVSLIFVVGLMGTVTNIFNIIVLRKSFKGGGPFKESLLSLAWIELLLSITTTGFMICVLILLENWNRDQLTMQFFLAFKALSAVTRTWSVYVTVMITIERYAIVAFPMASKNFLNKQPWKSRVVLGGVLLFCLVANLPWLTKYAVAPSEYESDQDRSLEDIAVTKELLGFPYITKYVGPLQTLPWAIREALMVYDNFLPFPLLVIFNGLLYLKIHNFNKRRSTLSKSQKRDINAAKMFSFVVLVLLLCHSMSSIVFVVTRWESVIFRELMLLQNFCTLLGASANFLIYYYFGPNFRAEFWTNVRLICGEGCDCIEKRYEKYHGIELASSSRLMEQNVRARPSEKSQTEGSL